MKEFRPAKKRVEVSVGESVRILRELQELSQSQLSELTGISQATISAIENSRVNLGVERAKVLARALKCHPAVLVFPGWEVSLECAAEPCEGGERRDKTFAPPPKSLSASLLSFMRRRLWSSFARRQETCLSRSRVIGKGSAASA